MSSTLSSYTHTPSLPPSQLRLAAANAEKIGRRAALADIKLSNLREAVAQKREEAKQKAEDRKAKFFDNRKAAGESKERRAQALQQACTDAADRRAKAIELTCEKSAAEYKHALTVAKEQKEKYEHDLIVASEKLELRLEAASSRRHAAMEAKMPTSPPGTTTSKQKPAREHTFPLPLPLACIFAHPPSL